MIYARRAEEKALNELEACCTKRRLAKREHFR